MPGRPPLAIQPASPGQVQLRGLLGEALAANHGGRLSRFIVDEDSLAIALFSPARTRANNAGDWYGEHAGKWLYAAAKACARTGDPRLTTNLRRVADYLVGLQDEDGYLGNYAPERRFMRRSAQRPANSDGRPDPPTWDVWTHSCMVLGLLEAHRCLGMPRWLDAARRIGDLCWRALTDGGIDITNLGNHYGLSATVLMDAALELHFATDEPRYRDLALRVLEQAENRPRHALLSQGLAGVDASEIATGKIYQLIWNLTALAKLYRATAHRRYLEATRNLWRSIRDHHLTLGGGPWGGVALRSREVFNPASVFSPHGYVETCSVLAWVQLNRELLSITGDAAHADAIERSAYNDLIGAQAPNGEDWCNYTFPNGQRVHTTYWRCCKSSGAMALEELPEAAYGVSRADGVCINLYGPSEARLELPAAGPVRLEQNTDYPFDGDITIRVTPERSSAFAVHARIPEWAEGAHARVNGVPVNAALIPGTYLSLERDWQPGDTIGLTLPITVRAHRKTYRNVQESRAPDGSPVAQQVLRFDYLAISRGPLVYASGLIDGYKLEESLRVPDGSLETWIESTDSGNREDGPDLKLQPDDRAAITFQPYYRAGGRLDGAWRLTWLPLAPE